MSDKLDKIIEEDRLYFVEQRLRHIEYDKENDVFYNIRKHSFYWSVKN